MTKLYTLLLLTITLLLSSCSKDELICGTIQSGDYEVYTDTYFFRVDGKKIWVDLLTFNSYRVGDYECFEDY